MNVIEDQQLLDQIAKGNSKAFGLLLEKYQDLVYGLSLKMVKDKSVAEDMAQETWMKVVQNASQYSPYGSVKSWILQINRNLILDLFRDQKKWKDSDDIDELEISDESADITEVIDTEEKQKN